MLVIRIIKGKKNININLRTRFSCIHIVMQIVISTKVENRKVLKKTSSVKANETAISRYFLTVKTAPTEIFAIRVKTQRTLINRLIILVLSLYKKSFPMYSALI